MNRSILFITMFLLCAFVVSCGTGGDAPTASTTPDTAAKTTKTSSANAAPDFEFKALDGKSYSISSFKGKVILLDFWATWCPPCRTEFPHFVELHNEYKDKGLVIIGCSLDKTQGPVEEFAKKNNVEFILTMCNNTHTELYGGVKGIPTTFIIDRQGNIVEKIVGGRPKAYFEGIIKPLL